MRSPWCVRARACERASPPFNPWTNWLIFTNSGIKVKLLGASETTQISRSLTYWPQHNVTDAPTSQIGATENHKILCDNVSSKSMQLFLTQSVAVGKVTTWRTCKQFNLSFNLTARANERLLLEIWTLAWRQITDISINCFWKTACTLATENMMAVRNFKVMSDKCTLFIIYIYVVTSSSLKYPSITYMLPPCETSCLEDTNYYVDESLMCLLLRLIVNNVTSAGPLKEVLYCLLPCVGKHAMGLT